MEDLKIESQVDEEFQKAVKAAKEFHPVNKIYIDGYTGEVSRYKTPDNYIPDEGVVNTKKDLCHVDDYVSVTQIYNRLKNMRALSIADSDFDLDESQVKADDLDDVTLSDVVSEVDDPADYQNYVEPFFEDKYGSAGEQKMSDSAAEKTAVESKNEERAPEQAIDE